MILLENNVYDFVWVTGLFPKNEKAEARLEKAHDFYNNV